MNPTEAQQAVAIFQAAFPSPRLPNSTVVMWANSLGSDPEDPHTVQDAQVAATQLALANRRMPSLSEFAEAIRQARFRRIEPTMARRLAAETPDQLLAAMRNGRGPSDDPA